MDGLWNVLPLRLKRHVSSAMLRLLFRSGLAILLIYVCVGIPAGLISELGRIQQKMDHMTCNHRELWHRLETDSQADIKRLVLEELQTASTQEVQERTGAVDTQIQNLEKRLNELSMQIESIEKVAFTGDISEILQQQKTTDATVSEIQTFQEAAFDKISQNQQQQLVTDEAVSRIQQKQTQLDSVTSSLRQSQNELYDDIFKLKQQQLELSRVVSRFKDRQDSLYAVFRGVSRKFFFRLLFGEWEV